MKKLSCILGILILILYSSTLNFTYAESENSYYGKIKIEESYFFYSDNLDSKVFKLPYSYFVKVKDIDGDFYQVTYKDLDGYALKKDIALMRGQPSSPYINATFTNYVEYALYEKPNTNSKIIHNFENEQTFNYYGILNGEEVSSKTNEWYYASATIEGTTYRGYIYSSITDNLPTISLNSETFEEISEDVFLQETIGQADFSSLTTGTKVLLIIAITIPSIFILFFLIKPSKLTIKKQKVQKVGDNRIRKVQHGDYFEFDEKDL